MVIYLPIALWVRFSNQVAPVRVSKESLLYYLTSKDVCEVPVP